MHNQSASLQLLQQLHPGKILLSLEDAAAASGKAVKTWRNHPNSTPFRTVKNGHLRQVHILDLAAWLDSALSAGAAAPVAVPVAAATQTTEKRGRGRPRKALQGQGKGVSHG